MQQITKYKKHTDKRQTKISIPALVLAFAIALLLLPLAGCAQTPADVPAQASTATPPISAAITAAATPEQTRTPAPAPDSTVIPLTIEEQMKLLPSFFGFTDLSKYEASLADVFYMRYQVNGEEKYVLFSLGAFGEDAADMYAVDVFSEYSVCSAAAETMLPAVLDGAPVDSAAFTFYPAAYQNQDVVLMEFGSLAGFLDSLSAKDGRDLTPAIENSGYRPDMQTMTLEQIAKLYLYALKDSEKVFGEDLTPPGQGTPPLTTQP